MSETPSSPRFSIVIPTHKNGSGLLRLLSSLTRVKSISEAEILIVQNPPLKFVLPEFKNLKIKKFESPQGVNFARNVGLKESKTEIIIFLDDDCWISNPDFLLIYEEAHIQNPEMTSIGGWYHNSSQRRIDQTYAKIQNDWLKQCYVNGTGESRSLLGGNFSIKQSRCHHFFDESIKYGGAETEFFIRLSQLGFRFLLIQIVVEHDPQVSLISFIKKAYLQGKTHRNYSYLSRKENFSFINPYEKINFFLFLYQTIFHLSLPKRKKKEPRISIKTRLRKRLMSVREAVCFYIDQRSSF